MFPIFAWRIYIFQMNIFVCIYYVTTIIYVEACWAIFNVKMDDEY